MYTGRTGLALYSEQKDGIIDKVLLCCIYSPHMPFCCIGENCL